MITPLTVGLISIVLLITLVLCGIRIGYAMGFISFVSFFLMTGNINQALSLVGSSFMSGIKEYGFAVMPLFVMVGVVLSVAELGEDIYISAEVLTGRVRGGLAMATVVANAIFAAIVGASIASAAAFSKISYGPMTRQGYDRKLAVGSIAGSSVLGMLIPPSLLFILFGMLTGTSVGKMFMAGIVPGIILAVVFCIQIAVMVKRSPDRAPLPAADQKRSFRENAKRALKPWGCFLLIFLVLGGIYAGVFTPTEAGAVGVFGALLIALFSKRLTGAKLKRILIETGATTGSVLLLLCTAKMYTRIIALSGMVNWLNSVLVASGIPIMFIIAIVLVICLGLGCIIDSSSIFLLVLPMLTPLLQLNNINMIWFGVVFTIVVEMGLITPPFGVCVFTVKSSLGDAVQLEEIFKGSMPYLLGMAAVVILLFAFPNLTMILPNLM